MAPYKNIQIKENKMLEKIIALQYKIAYNNMTQYAILHNHNIWNFILNFRREQVLWYLIRAHHQMGFRVNQFRLINMVC